MDETIIDSLRLRKRLAWLRWAVVPNLLLLLVACVCFAIVVFRPLGSLSQQEWLTALLATAGATTVWAIPQFVLLIIAWNRLDACQGPDGWRHLARVMTPIRYLLVHLCLTLLAGWAAGITVAILSFV